MAIAFLVFAVVLAVIIGTYWIFIILPEQESKRAVRARLKGRRTQLVAASLIKARERLSVVRFLDRILTRWDGVVSPMSALVARSGLRTTTGTVILACIFAAVIAMAAAVQLRANALIVLAAGALASVVPFLYVRRAASKRVLVFEEQFPEAIDLIARALRAGHALPTALQLVAEEVPEPVGGEFKQLFEQQNFGMSLPDALRAFGNRIPLVDARFFVTAVLTQREMGGNLSEVLDRLAAVIRERFKVKRQVRAVSAHGRITGVVLGFLPPSVAAVLFLLSPAHMRLLVEDPLGVDMVVAAMVLQVVGVLIIRRIVNVEF